MIGLQIKVQMVSNLFENAFGKWFYKKEKKKENFSLPLFFGPARRALPFPLFSQAEAHFQ
jgi:hypothetical protein